MPKYETKYNALKILDQCGMLYKKDFCMLSTKENVTTTYNALLDNKYINVRTIPKQGKKRSKKTETEDIVCLTKLGKNTYIEKEENEYFSNMSNYDKYIKQDKFVNHIFKTNKESELKRDAWPELTHQKTNLLFYLANVKTFPFQKPSLPYLWYNLSNNKGQRRQILNEAYKDKDLSNYQQLEIEKQLTKDLKYGIYYTKEELNEFFDYYKPESKDTFKGVNIQGMFISDKTCLLVFVSSYGENNLICYPINQMNQLMSKLIGAFCDPSDPMTDVIRPLKCISCTDDPVRYEQHGINALVISIGESLVYTMATAHKHGVQKGNNVVELRKSNAKAVHDYLDATSIIFNQIFVVQDNDYGISKLEYLTSRSYEKYYDEMINMFSNSNEFTVNKSVASRLAPGVYSKRSSAALYVPVHEIKFYSKIFENRDNQFKTITIITDVEMANAISHSVRKVDGLYFVATDKYLDDYGIPRDRIGHDMRLDDYYLYDEYGRVAGLNMLNEYLEVCGFKLKHHKHINNIAKKMKNYTTESLCNRIALNKIQLSYILENYINSKEDLVLIDGNKSERKIYKINFTLSNDENEYPLFEKLLEAKGYDSKSKLVKELIVPALLEEAKKYNIN